MPVITLPDGSQRSYDQPLTVADVAASIGPGLAKAALAGRVDGKLVDTSHLIDRDASVAIVTAKDADGLEILRHSTAHLLAQAVQAIYPDAQVTIGPVIEDGFYYDFAFSRPFTPDDLAKFEAKMHELAKADLKVERRVMSRDAAVETFKKLGEHYKAEIIASIPANEDISLYGQGDWFDLCRGPHVPSTGKLGAFKLMKVAGAYWRGDSKNAMLQRIYGTAWPDEKSLKAYLTRLEEAEKRDHRRLGRELDLYHTQEEAVGSVFWHPKGHTLWRTIEAYMRGRLEQAGYVEVKTPQLIDRVLWEKSGHWENYRPNMFIAESEDRILAVKPMNCPGHVLIYRQGIKSYRDLPLRMAEFGACHRNEPSGALHGLMRVRAFTQDDAHIFCTEDQINSETVAFCDLLMSVYKDFGFEDVRGQVLGPSGEEGGQRCHLGQGRGRSEVRGRGRRPRVHTQPGRRRLLRPQARIRAAGRHRPGLAVRHAAGRFRAAGAPRRRIHRRGRGCPPAGHAPPGHPRLHGAFHRHPDRKSRRQVPDLAGARAGRGDEYHRRTGRLRAQDNRIPEKSGASGRNGFAKRESRL